MESNRNIYQKIDEFNKEFNKLLSDFLVKNTNFQKYLLNLLNEIRYFNGFNYQSKQNNNFLNLKDKLRLYKNNYINYVKEFYPKINFIISFLDFGEENNANNSFNSNCDLNLDKISLNSISHYKYEMVKRPPNIIKNYDTFINDKKNSIILIIFTCLEKQKRHSFILKMNLIILILVKLNYLMIYQI